MDPHQDKENIKSKSRIPAPLSTLPALPNHLLKKISARPPLNTLAGPNEHNRMKSRYDLNTLCMAGPSNSNNKSVVNKRKSPFQIDTRFVTMERGCGIVDFNFLAYQDDKRITSEPSVITVSTDDENDDTKENGNKHCLANTRRISASTSALNVLLPATVKQIKRSLKRPHSRELQCLTPLETGDRGDYRAKRRLNFNERVHERMQAPDTLLKSNMANMGREYSSEIMSYLLQIESKLVDIPQVKSETRACIINWVMKINGVAGNPATIQTAVWYLDTVLSSEKVALENLQLLAAASYWIATKLHGPPTPASKLVQHADHAFSQHRLLEAEKAILVRLNFPRQRVVPQDYIYYFAWWCNNELPGELEVATTFLCLCGIMVIKSLRTEYPSVVAAASIRNALVLLNKKELIPRLQKCPTYVAAERKAENMSHTCSILRHAVCVVAAKDYRYKFLFEQYGLPPNYIAQTIANSANELAVMDIRFHILSRKMRLEAN